MDNPETIATLDTQDTWRRTNKTENTTHKTKMPDHTKNRGWTHVLAKGKQFLFLIRHPPCYSYIQSIPIKVLAVIEERKHLRKK